METIDYSTFTLDELKAALDQAEKDASKYHNLQLAKKIQLNSAYGALGNEYFRWFNFNHAEAITTSGQLSIRWVERKVNIYLNKVLSTKDIDYVIASDTDSIYVNMEPLVKQLNITDDLKITQIIDEFCKKKLNPEIEKSCLELSSMMNVFQPKLKMKRETIANKGIWKAKKMYILNAWNVEGVQYDSPKLKIQGIEAVRSSTPHSCRTSIKEALKLIMNKDEEALINYVSDFHNTFMTLPFEDIAFPRGVNGLGKYADKKNIYVKGTPVQVKGSLLFNDLIKKHNMKNVSPIVDGDKIKFAYLKLPNIIQDTVIAVPDELPPEFNLDKYIDRELQFKKAFLEPLKSITEIIGWNTEHVSNLESFFS